MNIIDRVRYVMFGDTPLPKAKASSLSATANPFARIILMLTGKSPVWTGEDYAALSEAGYQNCMTVYACVRLIAQTSAGIEWKVVDAKGNDLDKHPALTLMDRPNAMQGKRSFISSYFSYRLLSGNGYIIVGRVAGEPRTLWTPRPDRMQVLPGSGANLVGGYTYDVGGNKQTFEVDDVLHSKMFHPTNDWYGFSPLRVAAKGIDISNMAAEWNARVLTNDMRPPGALATEGKLDDSAFKRLQTMVKQEWQGYENIGNPLILEQGLKWISFAMSPKDLDWLNSTKVTKRDICTVYNVDPCLVGDSEYATYSNKIEARKGLYQDNILPAMYEFRDDLNMWLMPMFGEGAALDIDREKIEVLQEERERKFTYLAGADWLTVNEKREATGYEPVGDEGEVILVPIGKVPLEQATAEPEPVPEALAPFAGQDNPPSDDDEDETPAAADDESAEDEEDADEEKSVSLPASKSALWGTRERKDALWQNFKARVESKEKGIVSTARVFLDAQAKRVGAAAREAGFGPGSGRVVNVKAEAQAFVKAARSWYLSSAARAIRAGIQSSKGELPDLETKVDPFKMTPAQLEELSDMILYSGTKISESTMMIVRDVLKVAETEKWTVEAYTQELVKKLEDFAIYRCRLIGRTETAKVENWGELEGYKETGYIDKKGWLCSMVADSRETHIAADGQEVYVDEDFEVGGQRMAFPGDPRGDAGEVCNCLCALYPAMSK